MHLVMTFIWVLMLITLFRLSFSFHIPNANGNDSRAATALRPRAYMLACNNTETRILNIAISTLRELAISGAEASDVRHWTNERLLHRLTPKQRAFRTHFCPGRITQVSEMETVSSRFWTMQRAVTYDDSRWQIGIHCADVENICRLEVVAWIGGQGRHLVLVGFNLARYLR